MLQTWSICVIFHTQIDEVEASGVEHPLLVAGFGVVGGIYRVYAAELTPLLICLKGV
jgi:hypothetical protein